MASTIQIKRGTGSAVPSGLSDGELAINLDNGQLYFGSGSTSVNSFRFTNLTADNYTVSSSVTNYIFQTLSGSSDFGDDVGDIHNRTGSLNISGALSMNGDIELSNNDKIFVGSSGTEIIANNDDYWKIKANGVEAARFSSAGVTINEGGAASADFRVESDNDTHLLFVDAGANKMAIGTNTVSDSLLTVDGDVKVTNITASGNISSSGDIYTNRVFVNQAQSLEISGDDATLFGGHGSNKILLGKGNQTPSIFTNGAITASGAISASGTITANSLVGPLGTAAQTNITSVGTLSALTVSGDITANGNIVGDDSTNITNISNIECDALVHNGDTDTKITFGADSIRLTAGNSIATTVSTTGIDNNLPLKNKFNTSGDTAGNIGGGDVVFFGGTTSMTTGAIYHYKSDGTWELADATDNTKADGLLGVALGAASDNNGVLLRGMVTLDHDAGAIGDPIYLTATAGDASATAPGNSGNVVRHLGYKIHHATQGQVWFNPSNDWIEIA